MGARVRSCRRPTISASPTCWPGSPRANARGSTRGNEPNSRQFFVGTPATYVHLFTAGAAAVRRADPDAMVMSGGLSGNDSAWLNAAYQAGLGGQADAIAVHPYPSPSDLAPQEGSSNDPHRFPALASVRQVMDRNGDGQVPIWLTEIGWSVHDNPSGTAAWARGVTATRQASLVTSLVQVTTADDPSVIGITWYNARDRAVGSVQERHFGLLQRNLVPRPATDAFHAAVARARTSYAPSAARAQSLAGFPHRPTTAGVCR
jgi:hypothetical protein